MAGGVRDGELVLGILLRRHLKAVADGGMKLLDGRIDANALGGVHSVTNGGVLPAAHSWRAGVEVEDLQTVASECIHDAAVRLHLFGRLRFFSVASVAPTAIEDPPIVGQTGDYGDGEERERSPEP